MTMKTRREGYDVDGLTDKKERHPFNDDYDTGKKVLLGICDVRGVGGIGAFVNASLAMNVNSFEQLAVRIGFL
uniref:PNPLA domain-containing protein n=1 Tax=Angiostrongylus cantonensis TaxID=6313 RepID=A0A0K0DI07_ANGCA